MPQIIWDYNPQAIYINNSPFVLNADSPDGTVNSFTYFTIPAVVKVDAVTDCDNWCTREGAGPLRGISWVSTIGWVARIEFWVTGSCQWRNLTVSMLQQLLLLQSSTLLCPALVHQAKLAIFMSSYVNPHPSFLNRFWHVCHLTEISFNLSELFCKNKCNN